MTDPPHPADHPQAPHEHSTGPGSHIPAEERPYKRRPPPYGKLLLMVIGITLMVPIGQQYPAIALPVVFVILVGLAIVFKRDLDALRRLRHADRFCPSCGHDIEGDYSEPCANCGWDAFAEEGEAEQDP